MSSAPQNLKSYIDTAGSAFLMFFATVFFIVFVALYVRNVNDYTYQLTDAEVEKNLQTTGKLYLSRN